MKIFPPLPLFFAALPDKAGFPQGSFVLRKETQQSKIAKYGKGVRGLIYTFQNFCRFAQPSFWPDEAARIHGCGVPNPTAVDEKPIPKLSAGRYPCSRAVRGSMECGSALPLSA